MKRTTLIVLGGVVLVAALAAGGLVMKRGHEGGAAPAASAPAIAASGAKPALSVTVTTPAEAAWAQGIAANGSVAAWQETIVGAEQGGYTLTEVLANVGDRVKRGQVLARTSVDTLQVGLLETKAALAETEATLADAKANAERARQLQTTGAISAQQIAQYLTAEQTARARLAAQRARIEAAELKLSKTRILAPDDGVISARNATVGAIAASGQELFRLIRGGRLEWRAEVTASELSRLKPGMAATLTAPDGSAIAGKVRIVAPTIDPQTRNGIVYVDLPAGSAARAGMFARGEFTVGESNALTLPQAAVLLRDGFSYAFQVGVDGRVSQRKLATGRRVGDRIEVLSGLDAGARVVASGAGFLADGDLVQVVAEPAAPKASAPVADGTARGASDVR